MNYKISFCSVFNNTTVIKRIFKGFFVLFYFLILNKFCYGHDLLCGWLVWFKAWKSLYKYFLKYSVVRINSELHGYAESGVSSLWTWHIQCHHLGCLARGMLVCSELLMVNLCYCGCVCLWRFSGVLRGFQPTQTWLCAARSLMWMTLEQEMK